MAAGSNRYGAILDEHQDDCSQKKNESAKGKNCSTLRHGLNRTGT